MPPIKTLLRGGKIHLFCNIIFFHAKSHEKLSQFKESPKAYKISSFQTFFFGKSLSYMSSVMGVRDNFHRVHIICIKFCFLFTSATPSSYIELYACWLLLLIKKKTNEFFCLLHICAEKKWAKRSSMWNLIIKL